MNHYYQVKDEATGKIMSVHQDRREALDCMSYATILERVDMPAKENGAIHAGALRLAQWCALLAMLAFMLFLGLLAWMLCIAGNDQMVGGYLPWGLITVGPLMGWLLRGLWR